MSGSSSATILIVDDDAGLLRLVEKTLQREGFATATANSGKEAISWLAHQRADLMLLDLKLQDIEGKELVNHLDSIGRAVPFIVITGQGDELVAVEMMKRGALDYLVKDVRFIEFVPTVVRRTLAQIEKDRRLAFAEKRARLTETVVEQGDSGVLITTPHGPDPGIVYVNPAFSKLTGCSAEKLVGRRLSDLEALTERWDRFHRVLDTGQPFLGETQIRRCDGRTWFVHCNMTRVLDSLGAQTHWAVILHDVTERKQLEREILEISEREQARIGRDLHDGLGQQLTALELFSVSLVDELQAEAPKLVKPLKKISRQLREAIRQTRALAKGLSPVSLEVDGLVSALRKLADDTRALANARCEFVCEAQVAGQDPATATHLYRIAQEAVNNALKHGRAKSIRLSLTEQEGRLELQVSDDGRGFAPVASEDPGMGLRAMKYRADLIGAVLDVASAPRQGTRVTCTMRESP